jgi:hypothetical protein
MTSLKADFACSPACPSIADASAPAPVLAMAVVKMPVTSLLTKAPKGQQQSSLCSPPN